METDAILESLLLSQQELLKYKQNATEVHQVAEAYKAYQQITQAIECIRVIQQIDYISNLGGQD